MHFGVAHTRGDGFAWLPQERILFTGDACVNGPYNFMGDGDSEQWIKTLEGAKKLKPKIVCPGHGPMGGSELLDDQQTFFVELRKQVKKVARKKPDEIKAAVDDIRKALAGQERIRRYVGNMFTGQVEKVYVEMGGKPFLPQAAADAAQQQHARAHGH
jgi:glyoxylase-like metal-dependent hydrolase (beta-lactamase superfamily II)